MDPITGWIYIGSHDHHVYSLDIEVHYRLHMSGISLCVLCFGFFHLLLKRDHLNCFHVCLCKKTLPGIQKDPLLKEV